MDPCGGVFVAGRLHYHLFNNDVLVVKYDREGKELWQTLHDDSIEDPSGAAAGIAVDVTGHALLAGLISPEGCCDTAGWFGKVSSDGEFVWETEVQEVGATTSRAAKIPGKQITGFSTRRINDQRGSSCREGGPYEHGLRARAAIISLMA